MSGRNSPSTHSKPPVKTIKTIKTIKAIKTSHNQPVQRGCIQAFSPGTPGQTRCSSSKQMNELKAHSQRLQLQTYWKPSLTHYYSIHRAITKLFPRTSSLSKFVQQTDLSQQFRYCLLINLIEWFNNIIFTKSETLSCH